VAELFSARALFRYVVGIHAVQVCFSSVCMTGVFFLVPSWKELPFLLLESRHSLNFWKGTNYLDIEVTNKFAHYFILLYYC